MAAADQPLVLSKLELSGSQGTRDGAEPIEVPKHTRTPWIRTGQQTKDRTIESFARSMRHQFDRFGVTAADKRHVGRLVELLREWTVQ